MRATTIDEVILHLEQIIQTSITEESAHGYFAALYQKVTITVKEKLGKNYFDDDARMERLDVIFANRYLAAYTSHKQGAEITKSWEAAFHAAETNNLIVLQHLLLGMNAHINLDLGIAAAEISDAATIEHLQSDFNRINEILSTLIEDIQKDLSMIWPTLSAILRFTNKVDRFLVSFSMDLARNGAWKFANELVAQNEKEGMILLRDRTIAGITKKIAPDGIVERIIFAIIRFGERGNPAEKINALKN